MTEAKHGIVEHEDERKHKLLTKLLGHQHACLTGAKFALEAGTASNEPKQVRNGIDSAMVSHAALVQLLIKKNIITEMEYIEAMAEAWETEQKRYEEELSKHFGKNIHLR